MSCQLRSDATSILITAQPVPEIVTPPSWRVDLPVLRGPRVTLRELGPSDAPALVTMLSTEEVTQFIAPPPADVETFKRFIDWTHRRRAAGNYLCFGVVPEGVEYPIGVFQLWQIEPGFDTAEWGFAIGSPFWGTGAFLDGARLILDFAFEKIGIHRLEGRAVVQNGRGNGALRKVGAVQEGVLRQWFPRNGRHVDGLLWSIVQDDWRAARAVWRPRIH